jgi:hypothetical protein
MARLTEFNRQHMAKPPSISRGRNKISISGLTTLVLACAKPLSMSKGREHHTEKKSRTQDPIDYY